MPGSQDRPASFISKLCNILRSKENAKIIYWDTELKGIRILNQKRLEEIILPKYYRHNRFSSFVRQLNMYDFHKIHLPDHRSIFLHSEFDPRKKEQIHLIRRKVTFEQKATSDKEMMDKKEEDSESRKQNLFDAFLKSNIIVSMKQSNRSLCHQKHNHFTRDQSMEELCEKLSNFKDQKEDFQKELKKLKKDRKFIKFLKIPEFIKDLNDRLEIEWQEEKDELSELSIENQLVFKTKKSLESKSLRLVESGQLYFGRETIGNFLNMN